MRRAALSTQQSALSRRKIAASASVRRTFAIFANVLREIFDEAAYERFLERHELENSRAAYAHFIEEQDPSKKPRCC